MMNGNWSLSRVSTVAAGLLVVLLVRLAVSGDSPPAEWKAPPRAARKPNPVPSTPEATAAGKSSYVSNCLACHGPTGKGDGPAAVACNPRPKDLSDPNIAAQSDGELFWKITEGRKPMPSYEKLLTETQRWQVIDYVRVLQPKAEPPK